MSAKQNLNDCMRCRHYPLVWEGHTAGFRCAHPSLSTPRPVPTPAGYTAQDHHLDLSVAPASAGGVCEWHDQLPTQPA